MGHPQGTSKCAADGTDESQKTMSPDPVVACSCVPKGLGGASSPTSLFRRRGGEKPLHSFVALETLGKLGRRRKGKKATENIGLKKGENLEEEGVAVRETSH